MGIRKQYQQVKGSNTTGFALGLLIGATTGALVGMLVGPKSGDRMFRDLRAMANQGKDSLKNGWRDLRSKRAEVKVEKPGQTANGFREVDVVYTDNSNDAADILVSQVKSVQDSVEQRG